ncbi:MAG: asparaginase domain-containing protein [Lachnospiraceae bacterium]|nr:asparaginase domain-containing protein [Lachnospiraceae bacterium]
MKIGAIFTGGTIGSSIDSEGYISVSSGYKLIEMYYDKYDSEHNTEFITAQPYSILSENLDFDKVSCLAEFVDAMADGEELDGILIMHGTDTLQYTAGFLMFLLKNINKPVVLVSSAYVLDDPRANGLDNFKLALEFVEQRSVPGVYVSYMNSDGRRMIHRADRLLAHATFSSDVYSINNGCYAELTENGWIFFDGGLKASDSDSIFTDNRVYTDKNDNLCMAGRSYSIQKKVLFLHIYPGMTSSMITDDYDAILLESYHSGTGPVDGALADIAKKAKGIGIPVYLVGNSADSTQYETVKMYQELGIDLLQDIAPIAAYCALCCGVWKGRAI